MKNLKSSTFAGEQASHPPLPPEDVHLCPPQLSTPFSTWIATLRSRNISVNVEQDGAVNVSGSTWTSEDRTNIARHRHTLKVAAAGTHTEWWNHILQRPTRTLQLDDIPIAADDGEAFACSCCGQPAAHLDWELLPWCDTHA